jgi:hypothetical protein
MSDTDHSQTILEFCISERISRAKYFQLKAEGRGPREMRIGKLVRISPEARRDWRRSLEQPANPNEAA